ncbi:MAG: hypothetical protein RIQ92_809 [Actinomycetota bacterium]|jgi:hypothetical protein
MRVSEAEIEVNFDDHEHDDIYFELIQTLLLAHGDRYELQTSRLLHDKSIIVESQGSKLRFSLTPQGCSYSTIESVVSTKSDGWVRMGWGRASKRKALPAFFARAEASAILSQNSE